MVFIRNHIKFKSSISIKFNFFLIIVLNYTFTTSTFVMLPYLLYLLHVGRLLVACHDQVYQVQERQNYQSYVKDIVLVKSWVKPQIVDLESEYHIYFSIVCIRRKRTDAQLNNSHRSNQHQDNIEEETVHPSFIFFHRMKTTAKRYSDAEFDSSLLNTP